LFRTTILFPERQAAIPSFSKKDCIKEAVPSSSLLKEGTAMSFVNNSSDFWYKFIVKLKVESKKAHSVRKGLSCYQGSSRTDACVRYQIRGLPYQHFLHTGINSSKSIFQLRKDAISKNLLRQKFLI
jgi:hypothetical protein